MFVRINKFYKTIFKNFKLYFYKLLSIDMKINKNKRNYFQFYSKKFRTLNMHYFY